MWILESGGFIVVDKRIEINLVFEEDVFRDVKQLTFAKGMSGNIDLGSAVLNKIISYIDREEKEVVIGYKPKE